MLYHNRFGNAPFFLTTIFVLRAPTHDFCNTLSISQNSFACGGRLAKALFGVGQLINGPDEVQLLDWEGQTINDHRHTASLKLVVRASRLQPRRPHHNPIACENIVKAPAGG